MGDEKWCLYINMKRRKKWVGLGDMPKPKVKPELHPRKTMICVWWDWEGIMHWKMLERNAMVNKELYIAQLHCVNEAIQLKRPHQQGQTILLHEKRASCCTSCQSCTPRTRMGGPSASAVFSGPCTHRLLSFPLFVKPYEDLKNWLNKFFDTSPRDFWRNGTDKLVERWEEVVNNNGEYIIY